MPLVETKNRNFASGGRISPGVIELVHAITKDALSSVEDMRKANEEYRELFDQVEIDSDGNAKIKEVIPE
jgi:hypothetical protein